MSETPAIPPSVQSELQEVEARVDAIPVKPESRQLLHDLRWLISHVHWGYQSAVDPKGSTGIFISISSYLAVPGPMAKNSSSLPPPSFFHSRKCFIAGLIVVGTMRGGTYSGL